MKIVMIAGKQGSGKTTTANELAKNLVNFNHFVNHVKFADVIYEMHDSCLRILKGLGVETKKKEGKLLQLLGTDFGRNELGDDIWIRCLKAKIEKIKASYPPSQQDKLVIIIDDLRFENEFDAFPEALRVILNCPETIRMQRCSSWRTDINHPSETGLDQYASDAYKFDKTYKSNMMSTLEISHLIAAQLDKNNWIEKRLPTAVELSQ